MDEGDILKRLPGNMRKLIFGVKSGSLTGSWTGDLYGKEIQNKPFI